MTDQQGSERYPSLRGDVETAERILAEPYARADARANRFQRKFRRSELAIIWGGVAAVALAFGAGSSGSVGGVPLAEVFAFSEVALTAALGALAFVGRSLKWQRRWLRRRWAAEMLRGEKFLFLGGLGPYAGSEEPDRVLRQRIIEIEGMVQKGGKSDE